MEERRSLARGPFPQSALQNAAGEQVTVVHLAAEYYPYARSGGLAEAVANLARFQSSSSVRSLALLPLYRSARNAAGPLVEAGLPLRVRLGGPSQEARLLQQREVKPGTQVYFVQADQYFDRERLYGDSHGDYADNHLRYAFFTLAALEALPQLVDGPVLLHVHDWHAALALVYLRTRYAGDRFYDAVRTVLSVHNAGYQGH
jgi:starch synthase